MLPACSHRRRAVAPSPLVSPPAAEPRRQRVALLDADPELASEIPAGDRPRARQALLAPVYVVGAGPVDFAAHALPETTFALLVVRGLLRSDVTLAGRELSELLVAGDVVLPWEPAADGVGAARAFTAVKAGYVVALDDRFIRAAAAWPGLLIAIHRRLNDQGHRVATHGVICQLPRVEERIMAGMWHLAGRTGKVCAEGTVVPVRMTHQELGRLVGAQRPTVTLAVKGLAADGRLHRREDATWLLPRVDGDDLAGLAGGELAGVA